MCADVSIMAATLRTLALNPTADEVKNARKILSAADKGSTQNAKNQANKRVGTGLAMFVKSLKDVSQEDKDLVLMSRGPEREAFNLLYLIRQARAGRCKNETKAYTGTDTTASDAMHEWSWYQCKKELGPERAQGLADAKAITPIKCPLMGSTEAHMMIWLVPQRVTISSSSSGSRNEIGSVVDASEDDLKLLMQMTQERPPSRGSTEAAAGTPTLQSLPALGGLNNFEPVPVKLEKKTDEEIAAEQVKKIEGDIAGTLKQLHDVQILEMGWKTQAKSNPLADVFHEYLVAHDKKDQRDESHFGEVARRQEAQR